MLAPLLFNIFFAALMKVAYKRFKANKEIIDALVHPRKKKGGGGGGGSNCRRAIFGDAALSMLYADDARVVSQSHEQLRKMMGDRGRVRGVWPDIIGGQD